MKVELWVHGGAIKKLSANRIRIGMHTHPGTGEKYICVQVDDRELHHNNTLVLIDDGGGFAGKEYPAFLDLPLEYQGEKEVLNFAITPSAKKGEY